MARIMCIDIETVSGSADDLLIEESLLKPAGNIKDPAKRKKNVADKVAALPSRAALLDSASISCVGIKTEDEMFSFVSFPIIATAYDVLSASCVYCYIADSEKGMLINLSNYLDEYYTHETQLVHFNGKGFDLPRLRFRYAVNRLPLPLAFRPEVKSTDLMLLYSQNYSMNKTMFISMGEVAIRLNLLPGGKPMCGELFGELIDNKEYLKAILYNVFDCYLTDAIRRVMCA